jgi:hypothetical protein
VAHEWAAHADSVFGVEIWNEYNIHFSTGPAGSDPEAYATLATVAADRIREQRPDTTVVVGSTAWVDGSGKYPSALKWTRQMLAAGGAEAGDAVGVHRTGVTGAPRIHAVSSTSVI